MIDFANRQAIINNNRSLTPITWRSISIIAMVALWEKLPFSLITSHAELAYQLFSCIIAGGCIVFFYQYIKGRQKLTMWDYFPATLFASCILSSIIYSIFIAPQSFMGWVPAVYTISPLLSIFALKAIRADLSDCIGALYWSGFLGSLALITNNILDLHLLDFYTRGIGFVSHDRIVFFKIEATFGCMISIIGLFCATRILAMIRESLVFATCGYNLFFLSESRLAMIAFLMAVLLTWIFVLKGKQKLTSAVILVLVGVPVIYTAIGYYFSRFDGLGAYLTSDKSASYRRIENHEFYNFFLTTHGVGFGFMSGNPIYKNVLSTAITYGGVSYGNPNYGLYLDDLGLPSALYQFGIIGLCIVTAMTVITIVTIIRSKRLGSRLAPVSGTGFLMATWLISPISMNYFTLFYTAHVGALLWYIACCTSEQQAGLLRLRRRPDVGRSRGVLKALNVSDESM